MSLISGMKWVSLFLRVVLLRLKLSSDTEQFLLRWSIQFFLEARLLKELFLYSPKVFSEKHPLPTSGWRTILDKLISVWPKEYY